MREEWGMKEEKPEEERRNSRCVMRDAMMDWCQLKAGGKDWANERGGLSSWLGVGAGALCARTLSSSWRGLAVRWNDSFAYTHPDSYWHFVTVLLVSFSSAASTGDLQAAGDSRPEHMTEPQQRVANDTSFHVWKQNVKWFCEPVTLFHLLAEHAWS